MDFGCCCGFDSWMLEVYNCLIIVRESGFASDLEPGGGGERSKKFRQGCSCHFLGFEISQFVIFVGCSK